jgi:hypothetical protein
MLRATINASNVTAQQVDIAFTNSGGSTYIGQDAAGYSFIDARGALNAITLGYSGAVVTTIASTGLTMASGMSILGANNLTLNATTGNSVIAQVNNATVGAFSSTGLAVTGTLSSTGNLTVTGGTVTTGSATALSLATSGGTQVQVTNTASANRYITLTGSNGGWPTIGVSAGGLAISSSVEISGSGIITSTAGDQLTLRYDGSNVFAIAVSSAGNVSFNAGGASAGFTFQDPVTLATYLEGAEQTAPAAPAANGYRIYAEDNGSGKTRLMVKFATGPAQQIAIEP